MYGRKRFDKHYLFILVIVILALILALLSFALHRDRTLNTFEKIAQDAGTSILKVVSYPFGFVKEKLDEMHEKDNIYKKNKAIKDKEEKIDSVISENENYKDEISKLKSVLELNTVLSDKIYVNATVVTRNINYWYEEATIDKGSSDGITKNMAVVTPLGLIGKVVKVSNYSSKVQLLSGNFNDKISVKIKVGDDYVYGLISKYDVDSNSYTVEGISQNVDIPSGSDVVTTGMSDVFPSGIKVGTVNEVALDNFDLSKVVSVKASVNFDDIDYVSVLKRKDS